MTEKAAHPNHYNAHPSGVEARLLIEHLGFNVGTSLKYLLRAGLKTGEALDDDIDKAIVYLLFEEERIEKGWPYLTIEPRIRTLMLHVAMKDDPRMRSLLSSVLYELAVASIMDLEIKRALRCFDDDKVAAIRARLAARRPRLPEDAARILNPS